MFCECHTQLVYHFTIMLKIAEYSTARITEFNKHYKVILLRFFLFQGHAGVLRCALDKVKFNFTRKIESGS